MDKIYVMKLFVRVAERESFSRAAEDIGLPKGSVSRQIQALEHQLGIRLLAPGLRGGWRQIAVPVVEAQAGTANQ